MVVAETLYQGIDLTTMFWRKLLHTVNQKKHQIYLSPLLQILADSDKIQ